MALKTRALPSLVGAWIKPASAIKRIQRARAELESLGTRQRKSDSASQRLTALERFFTGRLPHILSLVPPAIASGLLSQGLASRLLRGLVTAEEMQVVVRALPHNPTTEMDLDLWQLSRRVAAESATAQQVGATAPEALARAYRAGTLPPTLQQGLADFLAHYGHRGVAEIDVGLPRWREDPTHILGVLANYLQLTDPALAPDALFRRGAREAEAMVAELTRRARRKGLVRAWLVGFFLSRARALSGLREAPKFLFVLILAHTRKVLQGIGEELAATGRLERGEDIFFLTLQEVHAALAGSDSRAIVRERRAIYAYESRRRHVPRVLLSDGTEPTPADVAGTEGDAARGVLRGTPASPGTVSGRARVILDPTGAHLEPGEILVAPSTDPGWTPLFLTAVGLVMEMGGAISHGAVVAREYGIPAVVGVAGATERISSGQRISVDGAAGTVVIEEGEALG
jgi:pyruvate,water dikinase